VTVSTADITQAIEARTESLTIERLLKKKGLNVSRIMDKVTQASAVAQRVTSRIEARADAIIAREPGLDKRTDDAFSPHDAILNDAENTLLVAERALGQMSNGGDPLHESNGSLASSPAEASAATASS